MPFDLLLEFRFLVLGHRRLLASLRYFLRRLLFSQFGLGLGQLFLDLLLDGLRWWRRLAFLSYEFRNAFRHFDFLGTFRDRYRHGRHEQGQHA